MAEAVRFELTVGFHPRRFSRPEQSTALPRFRRAKIAKAGVKANVFVQAGGCGPR